MSETETFHSFLSFVGIFVHISGHPLKPGPVQCSTLLVQVTLTMRGSWENKCFYSLFYYNFLGPVHIIVLF